MSLLWIILELKYSELLPDTIVKKTFLPQALFRSQLFILIRYLKVLTQFRYLQYEKDTCIDETEKRAVLLQSQVAKNDTGGKLSDQVPANYISFFPIPHFNLELKTKLDTNNIHSRTRAIHKTKFKLRLRNSSDYRVCSLPKNTKYLSSLSIFRTKSQFT